MAVSQAGHIVTRPPEMGRMYYDHRSDIWSVGKVALLLARLAKLPEVIQIQRAEDVEYGDWHPFLRNFVQRCLQPQHSRDDAASMLQVLPPAIAFPTRTGVDRRFIWCAPQTGPVHHHVCERSHPLPGLLSVRGTRKEESVGKLQT